MVQVIVELLKGRPPLFIRRWGAPLSFSEGDCTKYQESAALPELAACKAA